MDEKARHHPDVEGPLLANTDNLPWHSLGEGIEFQLLRYSRITGDWALFVRMQPGSTIRPHVHLSSGEFFVTKGELLYDRGSAPAGVYGYEALGEVHNEAHADELTEYLFLGRGPVAFPNEDGQVEFILDWDLLGKIDRGELGTDVT